MRALIGITGAALAVTLLAGCGSDAAAKESGNFEGKTIEFVVPFSPGGGYDTYARQLAPELAEELGATVVVVNKPGAGGLIATNELWNTKPDGLTISIFNTVGHIGSALAEADGVQYEAEGFSYIGRLSQEPDVLVTKSGGDLKSFEDVLDAEGVRFGAGGVGSLEYIDAAVLQEIVGVNGDIVSGFEGSSEAGLALLAGNIDLHALSLGSQLPAIESGDTDPLLVIGSGPVEGLEGVPTVMEFATDENRDLLENHTRLLESGRVLAAPPAMDEQLLNELRGAFENVVTDKAFVEESSSIGRPVDFLSGPDTQTLVEDLMNSPQEYVSVLKSAFDG